jgi:hypothetical protein
MAAATGAGVVAPAGLAPEAVARPALDWQDAPADTSAPTQHARIEPEPAPTSRPDPAEVLAAGLPDMAWLEQALAEEAPELAQLMPPLLGNPSLRERWLSTWPMTWLPRLFSHLRGRNFLDLLPFIEALTAAAPEGGSRMRQRGQWHFLADLFFPENLFRSIPDAVVAYVDFLSARIAGYGNLRQFLCDHLSEDPTQQRINQHLRFWLLARSGPRHLADLPPASSQGGLLLGNAGLVLASPYLPRLFAMLELTANNRFHDPAAAQRACQLLQFLAEGRTAAAETPMPLNKLLCGLDVFVPLAPPPLLEERETRLIEEMIRSMIAHWSALGKTSVAGMRETFLQRNGHMHFKNEAWQLKVESKAFDVLLDRLPWSFSIIRHPWMSHPIMVEWR